MPRLSLDTLGALDAGAASAMVVLIGNSENTIPELRDLRARGVSAPVLVFGGAIDETEVAELLDAGADDVIGPDCGGRELAARLRAVARRAFQKSGNDITLGELNVPLDGGPVSIAGVAVSLSAREQEVLRLVALRYPRRVSKATLYDALFALSDKAPPHLKVIDSHIHNLRRKMTEADPRGRDWIETAIGLGYRLQQHVE